MSDQMPPLNEAVALVTGASTGIGRAIVTDLCQKGVKVAGVARTESTLKEALEDAATEPDQTLAIPGDVSEEGTADRAVNTTVDSFGRLDILVNNAGITRDNLLMRMDREDWDDVMDVNLGGTFNFTKAVTRQMMKQRSGRIINVSSVVGLRGNAGQANYVASKAGIAGFTKSVARELGSRNITANAVAPGYIKTNMTEDIDEEKKEELAGELSIERLGEPEDVAGAVTFLAGPDASYITGQVLVVDGGMHM
jgi:3-oxoacyl-[acyl-carrier protein] reductase